MHSIFGSSSTPILGVAKQHAVESAECSDLMIAIYIYVPATSCGYKTRQTERGVDEELKAAHGSSLRPHVK